MGKLWRASALGAALLACACTSGGFTKREHFADYGGKGRANYYRVTVAGKGDNGKVDYRSGWYDARAVDDLFGNVGKTASDYATIAPRLREALRTTHAKYMEALEDPALSADVPKRRANYLEVLNSVTGLTTADGNRASPLDHAGEKFVMVFSNDPEKVIEAIKGHIQKRDLKGSLVKILSRDLEREDAEVRTRLGFLLKDLESARGVIGAKERALATSETPPDAAALRAMIGELETRLEAIR